MKDRRIYRKLKTYSWRQQVGGGRGDWWKKGVLLTKIMAEEAIPCVNWDFTNVMIVIPKTPIVEKNLERWDAQ